MIIIVLRCAVREYNSNKKPKGNLITSHYVESIIHKAMLQLGFIKFGKVQIVRNDM